MPVTIRGTDILMNSGAVIQDPPGTAPGYVCRAWVNFNGTGTVAIRAAGNVSSITDNGTGNYTVNFTTAMVDANYSVVGTDNFPQSLAIHANAQTLTTETPVAGSVTLYTRNAGGFNSTPASFDSPCVSVAVFR